MTVSIKEKGTKTAVIAEEHILLKVAEAGTFTFHVDTNKMAAGDVLEMWVTQMTLKEGTSRVLYWESYQSVQSANDLIKVSVPVSNALTDATALQFVIKQPNGTGREFPWQVLKYA